MKSIALLFISFSISLAVFSQKINGQWRGYFNSRGDIVLSGAGNTEYVLELEINGNTVSGYSYSYFQGRKFYVICSLKGTYYKGSNSIKVIEAARIKGNTPPDFSDCLQIHYLTYYKNGDEEKLEGRWEEKPNQPGGGCGTGATTLIRRTLSKDLSSYNKTEKPKAPVQKPSVKVPAPIVKKPLVKAAPQKPIIKNNTATAKKIAPPAKKPAPSLKQIPKADIEIAEIKKPDQKAAVVPLNFEKRKTDVLKTIQIENETFTVNLYDNGDIDGDTVSLFYNGKLLLSHKRLTDKPITLTLDASNGQAVNELTMYADNLGEIPPNTALMVVSDGDKRYEVRISSDLKNSGTIHFVHKQKTQ